MGKKRKQKNGRGGTSERSASHSDDKGCEHTALGITTKGLNIYACKYAENAEHIRQFGAKVVKRIPPVLPEMKKTQGKKNRAPFVRHPLQHFGLFVWSERYSERKTASDGGSGIF